MPRRTHARSQLTGRPTMALLGAGPFGPFCLAPGVSRIDWMSFVSLGSAYLVRKVLDA